MILSSTIKYKTKLISIHIYLKDTHHVASWEKGERSHHDTSCHSKKFTFIFRGLSFTPELLNCADTMGIKPKLLWHLNIPKTLSSNQQVPHSATAPTSKPSGPGCGAHVTCPKGRGF